MAYSSGLVKGVIKKLSKPVFFFSSPLTLDSFSILRCLLLSLWKVPWAYPAHTYKLSAAPGKKKKKRNFLHWGNDTKDLHMSKTEN